MPRHLQSEIHSDFSSETGVWANYKNLIIGLYDSSQDPLKTDFDNHLIREYNRKIHNLGQSSGLFITPFDAGYRFVGEGIPDLNYVFLYTIDDEQVFTNTDQAVQVPDDYANS
jgi:hypothetical protein